MVNSRSQEQAWPSAESDKEGEDGADDDARQCLVGEKIHIKTTFRSVRLGREAGPQGSLLRVASDDVHEFGPGRIEHRGAHILGHLLHPPGRGDIEDEVDLKSVPALA